MSVTFSPHPTPNAETDMKAFSGVPLVITAEPLTRFTLTVFNLAQVRPTVQSRKRRNHVRPDQPSLPELLESHETTLRKLNSATAR